VFVRVCVCLCACACACACACVCVCVCVFVCMCVVFVCMLDGVWHLCVFVCVCAWLYVSVYVLGYLLSVRWHLNSRRILHMCITVTHCNTLQQPKSPCKHSATHNNTRLHQDTAQMCLYVCICMCMRACSSVFRYGVALVSRIDKIIGLFCTRAPQKSQYSAKETYNFIDITNRSHPICQCLFCSLCLCLRLCLVASALCLF